MCHLPFAIGPQWQSGLRRNVVNSLEFYPAIVVFGSTYAAIIVVKICLKQFKVVNEPSAAPKGCHFLARIPWPTNSHIFAANCSQLQRIAASCTLKKILFHQTCAS
jgi:hypothetical protein